MWQTMQYILVYSTCTCIYICSLWFDISCFYIIQHNRNPYDKNLLRSYAFLYIDIYIYTHICLYKQREGDRDCEVVKLCELLNAEARLLHDDKDDEVPAALGQL